MKDYFGEPNPSFSDMQEEGTSSSSATISPLEEDPVLSFPSSQSVNYIASSDHQLSSYVNEYSYYPSQGYSSSSTDSHSALMYTGQGLPFMSPDGTFTTTATPSPSSSMSSSSIPNFATAGTMYYPSVSKECPAYNDITPFNGGDPSSESGTSDFEMDKKYCKSSSIPYSSSRGVATDHRVTTSNKYIKTGDYHGDHHHHRNGNKVSSSSAANVARHKSNKDTAAVPSNKKSPYAKRQCREKGKKRCSNCHASQSPSWRRSIAKHSKGELLCNACGLYEKTAKKKRMLVINDDGNTKVVRKRDARDYCCSTCGAKDVTRWRKMYDQIQCERCARGSRMHSK